jgi:hypothetical protein
MMISFNNFFAAFFLSLDIIVFIVVLFSLFIAFSLRWGLVIASNYQSLATRLSMTH